MPRKKVVIKNAARSEPKPKEELGQKAKYRKKRPVRDDDPEWAMSPNGKSIVHQRCKYEIAMTHISLENVGDWIEHLESKGWSTENTVPMFKKVLKEFWLL